jgi:hypothetical protein
MDDAPEMDVPSVLFPAGSKAGGTCTAGAPDVCKVPSPSGPVPTPFPNTAMVANANKTSTKVVIENKAAVVETSEIPNSNGDEVGSTGGVVSSTTAGPVAFKKGSSKVVIEGKGAAYQTGSTAHNGSNPNVPVGLFSAPSQSKVLVSP